ncbi:SagB/ThcOx family dehydrogenase [Listeria aquatica]|uniref:SagB-type dehydrogenase domain-containing protein n=1 Tax=Listeria aquatica FSL S10-1188 TaxID=1265818 RepID=W7B6H8_9LIST|nr:SagB/ThcOx family dehydrogenase [Listeria aquatica]EUJ21532.1 SagB-type dehydrogenase domain-containing protein [Listeria aquatica FSL S10-1188]
MTTAWNNLLDTLQMELVECGVTDVIRLVHEVIDDTPYKTKNYEQYKVLEEDYYIENISPKYKNAKNVIKLAEVSDNLVNDLLQNRKSVRDYANEEMTFSEFSTLMSTSFGWKETFVGAYSRREFPVKKTNSQGGINYLDMYLFINNVENIESGIYYYNFLKHELVQIDHGNVRPIINKIHYQNEFITYANICVLYVADFNRVSWKYLRRSYRFAHVDTGIAAANLQITAESLGLGSCIVAGYLEHEVEKYLELESEELPILSVSIGKKCQL